ncbi:hypothetical protein [Geobacter benzoatilyticus]|uniref:Nucleoside phosphorylase domain-containing protein n=1 Tax=Geobacter benzoatilyticus TaxID=2815309 RepID=A0ABX7Q3G1_9BACT|nr:hypothetical protein [Geobacter benzoatilyticus]QSV45436.1 hypothetical protein JZM60_15155 [Geobacter benzoatilyticus]
MSKNIKREQPEVSCRSISYLIGKAKDPQMKSMMEDDLLFKFKNILSIRSKSEIALKVLATYAPDKMRSIVEQANINHLDGHKNSYDVLILAIVPIEFITIKQYLNLKEEDNQELSFKNYRFWECDIYNNREKRNLRCLVTMIGDATNPRSAIATNSALSRFKFDLAILVGIAAGPKEETKLSDVIIANQIIDYENKRLEPDKIKNRPEPQSINSGLRKQVGFFITSDIIRDGAFAKAYREQEQSVVSSILPDREVGPEIKFAPILAGDKLLADGLTIESLIDQYHDKARAVEMEANGFVLACEDDNIPWLVFRGISDFGDPGKTGLKPYQANAAYSAILACKLFLENQYSQVSGDTF